MTFEDAVKATPQICDKYCTGLKALGKHSAKIKFSCSAEIDGSVNIDEATKQYYPNDYRWDYVVGYKGRTYFFEIHPAATSQVDVVKRKYEWLKNWLRNDAPKINSLEKANNAFFWIYTNRFDIPYTSTQYKKAVAMGLKPIREFVEKKLEQ